MSVLLGQFESGLDFSCVTNYLSINLFTSLEKLLLVLMGALKGSVELLVLEPKLFK